MHSTFNCQSSFLNSSKNRQTQMSLTSLFRTNSTYYICPIINCLLSMESSLFSGESLVEYFGFLIDTKIAEGVLIGFGCWGGRERPRLTGDNPEGDTCCW